MTDYSDADVDAYQTERPLLLPRKDSRVVRRTTGPGPWLRHTDALDRAFVSAYSNNLRELESRWVAPKWWPFKRGEL